MRKKNHRFSVSFPERDYQLLLRLAKKRRPPLTLQYLVEWAVQDLLRRVKDPKFSGELGNPTKDCDENH
jgi:hypothetical protein